MRFDRLLLVLLLLAAGGGAAADEAAKMLVDEVVAAAGGEQKLLTLFQFRERVLIVATPAPALKPDEQGNRTSVVEVGKNWWIGTAKRDKDKVRVLAWAWSLRILLDPQCQIERHGEIDIAGRPADGVRVTGVISEPLDLYFDRETKRLAAIDYTDTRHIFSEWKQTTEGHHYPSHVVGYRFADKAARTLRENQWYQTDILELTPLSELPAGLK